MASSVFLPGTKVEVRSNEDGFRGGWFEAAIMKYTRKHRRYAISYASLVTGDDPPKPVEETVYYNFVRPRPPPPREGCAGTFKIHQVVETYHNDGWWEGVVWKVPKWRNGVYTVCFPSSREVLQFKAEEMREQLEWVKGAWVPVQDQGGDAIFCVGSLVEVSRDEKNYGAAWFVGTVLKVIGKSYFWVMYKNLRIGDGGGSSMLLKEIVDREYIRPCPPNPSEFDSFNALDEVEAFHKDGWLLGVVTCILPGSRYIVKSNHRDEEFELDQNFLRPLFNWTNGQWVRISQEKGSRALVSRGKKSAGCKQKTCAVERDEVPLLLTSCESNGEFDGENVVALKVNESKGHRAEGGVETSQPCKKLKKMKLLEQLKWANETESGDSGGPRKHKQRSQAGKGSNPPITVLTSSSNDGEVAEESVIMSLKDKNVQEPNFENVANSHQSCKKSKSGKSVKDNLIIVARTLTDGAPKSPDTAEKSSLNATTMSEGTPALLNEENHTRIYPSGRVGTESDSFPSLSIRHKHDIAGASDNDELDPHCTRKWRKKLVIRGPYRKKESHHAVDMKELTQEELKECKRGNGLENIIEMERSSVNPTSMEHNLCDHNKFTASALQSEKASTDSSLSNTEKAVSEIEEAPSDPIPMASSPPDKDICDNDEIIPSTCPTKKAIIEKESVPIESLSNEIALPFPKVSSMWRIVESMETFHSIPQQPHFRELNQYLSDFREGMAIGLMLTFANIVDDVRKLRITDSHDIIERKLEALAALESNGFDVQVVRSHLEKLLVIQSNAIQSAAKQAFLEGEILERENEIHQLDEAITEHDKVISKLEEYLHRCQERRTALLLEENSKESEVLQLKRDLKAAGETYYSAKMHFNATKNVPW